MLVCDGESRDREADAAVSRQPTDDNPTAAPRPGNGYGRKTWMATIQNSDPTPRSGDDPTDRRGEGDGQLGQRRVADIDARTPAAEAVKNV